MEINPRRSSTNKKRDHQKVKGKFLAQPFWKTEIIRFQASQEAHITIKLSLDDLSTILEKLEKIQEEFTFSRMHAQKLDRLTTQEQKVARLILAGKTNERIASDLSISPHTVRTHRNKIYRKLDVSNHQELMKYAYLF